LATNWAVNPAPIFLRGQLRSLLDKRVGDAVGVAFIGMGIARRELVIELAADCLHLTVLELGNLDTAPALGGTNERAYISFKTAVSPQACGISLVAPARFAEQPLEQIGCADRPATAERETQIGDARLEVVVETCHRRRQIPTVGYMAAAPANAGRGCCRVLGDTTTHRRVA
jgi:hypothetical protein